MEEGGDWSVDEMLQILHQQGIAGLHGKALLCEAELYSSVSCAFTTSHVHTAVCYRAFDRFWVHSSGLFMTPWKP